MERTGALELEPEHRRAPADSLLAGSILENNGSSFLSKLLRICSINQLISTSNKIELQLNLKELHRFPAGERLEIDKVSAY